MTFHPNHKTPLRLPEYYLYGSSRVGAIARNVEVAPLSVPVDSFRESRILGYKQYELSNHLGNVLATITGQKEPIDTDTDDAIDYWQPRIVGMSDYYPFGAIMPGRSGSASEYRFGFQGQEMDDEIYGNGNAISYMSRVHDPRIGNFLSLDAGDPRPARMWKTEDYREKENADKVQAKRAGKGSASSILKNNYAGSDED